MINNHNLYNTLFSEEDEQDGDMIAINGLYDHLNFDKMSNYVDLNSYNSSLSHIEGPSLSVMHMNIRSLSTNLPHLEVLLVSLKQTPDILVLTETWLSPLNKDTVNINGYYSHNIARDHKAHGGVSIYIKQSIDSTFLEKYSYIKSIQLKILNNY